MLIAGQILSIILILATAMALLFRKEWWIKVFDFPRLQIISLLTPGIIIQIIWFQGNAFSWIILSFSLLAFAIQFSYIAPYFPFSKKEIPDSDPNTEAHISFLISNVRMSNRKCDKLKELIVNYSSDIVLLVETNQWWADAMETVMSDYPHQVKRPLENTYGMLLYSKIPIQNASIEYIVKEEVPSIHGIVEKNGVKIALSCLHPEPPAPEEADTSKPRDKELIIMGKRIREQNLPHVVMGDLNDVAWSDTSNQFTKIAQMKDPRKGRGFMNTFHAKIPVIRWALDHIFISHGLRVTQMKRLPSIGSDHFPVFIKCGIIKP